MYIDPVLFILQLFLQGCRRCQILRLWCLYTSKTHEVIDYPFLGIVNLPFLNALATSPFLDYTTSVLGKHKQAKGATHYHPRMQKSTKLTEWAGICTLVVMLITQCR